MRDTPRPLPIPTLITPELARLIPTGGHEIQILLVRNFVLINRKGRNVGGEFLKFVVPAEDPAVSMKAESRLPGRNLNHSVLYGRGRSGRAIWLWNLSI